MPSSPKHEEAQMCTATRSAPRRSRSRALGTTQQDDMGPSSARPTRLPHLEADKYRKHPSGKGGSDRGRGYLPLPSSPEAACRHLKLMAKIQIEIECTQVRVLSVPTDDPL
ncbi:hypothetical protein NDU88_005156 [Pleurodeles waltl]|uniref:Uncharacterized protein n=1 Tax=Pleurodeles waltl TaxID=8319 RepID=A0AAV7SKV0_PLEWA|nr:hypothetical protein NDU88_005156 [Pleurodeles waltl]